MAIRPITSTRPSRNVTHGNRHGTVRFLLWEIPMLLLLDHKRPKGHHLCLAFEIWGERNPTSHVNFCTGQWSTERERERESIFNEDLWSVTDPSSMSCEVVVCFVLWSFEGMPWLNSWEFSTGRDRGVGGHWFCKDGSTLYWKEQGLLFNHVVVLGH